MSDTEDMLKTVVKSSELFTKLIELLPYPAQVYAPDGTLIMLNSAFINEFNIIDPGFILGKYNVLQDPVAEEYGAKQNILDAFSGKVVHAVDLKVPVHALKKYYNIPTEDIEAFYQDISTMPIKNDNGEIICVVNILITRSKLYNRVEIARAKAYMEANWYEEFNLKKVAKAVYLSPAHFSRLFKTVTGMTPHDYYINIKISKIREKLLDTNFSIEKAFAECGVHYHGHYASLFREKTGLTPSEYRKSAQT